MVKRATFRTLSACSLCLCLAAFLLAGCTTPRDSRRALPSIDLIRSPHPQLACTQALEVINGNPYSQELFEQVFARIVEQLKNSKSPENADLIWANFVVPLRESGKVPADLARTTWNYYFSSQFVSLPSITPVRYCCHRLPEIKKSLEKEFQLKKAGFEICQQGSPEYHFLNAMYVYNTIWAACDTNE